ncbi:hypothetical protein EV361DRAFT_1036589 [Lentinula raphanica]|nr:hypothetical protein EV361DRAFT_1036589 [Lentinula raphanica]
MKFYIIACLSLLLISSATTVSANAHDTDAIEACSRLHHGFKAFFTGTKNNKCDWTQGGHTFHGTCCPRPGLHLWHQTEYFCRVFPKKKNPWQASNLNIEPDGVQLCFRAYVVSRSVPSKVAVVKMLLWIEPRDERGSFIVQSSRWDVFSISGSVIQPTKDGDAH